MLGLVLALSVAGLAVGPLLYAGGRGRASTIAALDGLTLGLVPPLVVLRLAPHVYDEIGSAAPILMAVGYGFVWLLERRGHGARGARLASAVVVSALIAHALGDGAALAVTLRSAEHAGAGGAVFALALLLHRLPEGLVVTRALVPTLGWTATLVRLGLMAGATLVGAMLGRGALETLPEGPVEGLVALGLGALVRWVVHTHDAEPAGRRATAAAGVAFVAGLALALALPTPHSLLERAQPRELALGESFLPLFVECAPALLAGAVVGPAADLLFGPLARGRPCGALSGLAAAFRLAPTKRALASWTHHSVARRPAGVVATWALASAALAVDVHLLSARLLGLPWALARALAGGATAIGVGLLVALASRTVAGGGLGPTTIVGGDLGSTTIAGGDLEPTTVAGDAHEADRARGDRSTRSLFQLDGVGRAFRRAAPGLLAGLLLAALAEAALLPSPTASTPGLYPLARWSLAAWLALGGRAALPLAAVAVHKGFSPGLVLGLLSLRLAAWPAALPAIGRKGGAGAAAVFVAGTLAASAMAGFSVDRALSPSTVPDVHPLVAHDHHPLEWVAAAAAGAGLLAGLVRRGPRRWLRDAFART